MAHATILNPNDQPTGKWRLIEQLKLCLRSTDYDSLFITVAYAKTGPLLRLQSHIEKWTSAGKTIESIFGINHVGTSRQALEFALKHFTKARLLYSDDWMTFHPKMYLFMGPRRCRFFIGSHNLTVGGTETNWESGTQLDLELPADEPDRLKTLAIWGSLVALANDLSTPLIKYHDDQGDLLDEAKSSRRPTGAAKPARAPLPAGVGRPKVGFKPPSPLPPDVFKKASPGATKPKPAAPAPAPLPVVARIPADALVIQIVPHQNGEVFLSKIAVDQNPWFFGFPFTGRTTPKKASNPSYPQRTPDPVVNLVIHGAGPAPLLQIPRLNLNTVFYDEKSEIRVTVPPQVVKLTPDFSILLMRQVAPDAGYDYDFEIFTPSSPEFADYVAACNQTLPSGGKPKARKMGWL